MAKSLLEFVGKDRDFVDLNELAVPYALNVCEHLKHVDRQGARPTGPFLDACRKYNRGEISLERLQAVTARYGFLNVIDAFHVLEQGDIPVSFFRDERQSRNGIALTDTLFDLHNSQQRKNLAPEVESRWRLVETAWELRINRSLVAVQVDFNDELLYVAQRSLRRPSITSCRDALNGYQKGKCFYCFCDISIESGSEQLAHVDHFIPRRLFTELSALAGLDGVWNLVLACQRCNGPAGKWGRVAHIKYLERLDKRNSHLIDSHDPLKETLILQTGASDKRRRNFLQAIYAAARDYAVSEPWLTAEEGPAAF